jgi:hypothetical protein
MPRNQFGLIWSEFASFLSSTMPWTLASLHLGSQNHELSLWAFFFSFGCQQFDFPSKIVPHRFSLDLLLWGGGRGFGLSSKDYGSNLCSSQPIGLLHSIGSWTLYPCLKCPLIFFVFSEYGMGPAGAVQAKNATSHKPPPPPYGELPFHYVVMDYITGESSPVTRKKTSHGSGGFFSSNWAAWAVLWDMTGDSMDGISPAHNQWLLGDLGWMQLLPSA